MRDKDVRKREKELTACANIHLLDRVNSDILICCAD